MIESLVNLQEESFATGIKEVLENPKYTNAVKKFSELYRDRPLSARKTLVYWIDYVIRHHGATHLQSPVVHMSFIAANNLDIYVICMCVLLAVFFATRFVLRLIVKRVKGSPNVPKQKVKMH